MSLLVPVLGEGWPCGGLGSGEDVVRVSAYRIGLEDLFEADRAPI